MNNVRPRDMGTPIREVYRLQPLDAIASGPRARIQMMKYITICCRYICFGEYVLGTNTPRQFVCEYRLWVPVQKRSNNIAAVTYSHASVTHVNVR